jgi:hypothetical protein
MKTKLETMIRRTVKKHKKELAKLVSNGKKDFAKYKN